MNLWLGWVWSLSSFPLAMAEDTTTTASTTVFTFEERPSDAPSTVMIRCPGARPVTVTAMDTFRFEGLADGICTAHVSGAIRARFRPVLAGERYQCRAATDWLFCNSAVGSTRTVPQPGPVPRAAVSPTEPPGDSGVVQVDLERPDLAVWGLVTCPGGTRVKAVFVDGVARFGSVPDEDCVLTLKGGSPVRFADVRPNDHITCTAVGRTAICADHEPAAAPTPVVSTASAPVAHRASPAPLEGGVLEVRLSDPETSTWLYVQCPSGVRKRAEFEQGVARVNGMPDEACVLSFRGISPARFSGVSGGQRLTCTLAHGLASCVP